MMRTLTNRMPGRLAALLSLVALAACGDGQGPTQAGPAEVARVEVTAPADTVDAGGTIQLSATPRTGTGAAVPGASVTWASSNEAAAIVSSSGFVTAVAPGTAVIRATSGGRTGEAVITVRTPQVASLEILSGAELVLDANGNAQLQAVARSATGAAISGIPVAWSSSNELVARVTELGIVYGGVAGSAIVRAEAGGRSAQVVVRVRAPLLHVLILPNGRGILPGQTLQLRARGITAAGDSVEEPITWASENEGVATVDPSGRVTAHRAGSAVIRATMRGVTGRAIVPVYGVTEQRLEQAAGQPLPAQVGTRRFRDGAGVLHEQRVVVTGGVLRMGNGYEQRLTLEVYEGDARVSTETYEDRGQLMYNVFTGDPMFESTLRPGLSYAGEWSWADGYLTGEVTLSQALGEDGDRVPFFFGKP